MCQPLSLPIHIKQSTIVQRAAAASHDPPEGSTVLYRSPACVSADVGGPADQASQGCCAGPRGSRRHRLWELDKSALCPIIGVCLPLPVLRRQTGKWLGGQVLADDYSLHCGTIAQCQSRNALSEALNKELDRRNALALRLTRSLKDASALQQWWNDAASGTDLAAALWATLTHSKCDTALRGAVLAQVHMLQHQLGNTHRVDQTRLQTLQKTNALLKAEITVAHLTQQRHAIADAQHNQQLQTDLAQTRVALADLQQQTCALHQQQPLRDTVALEKKQQALETRNAWQRERINHLERTLAQMHREMALQHTRLPLTPVVCEPQGDVLREVSHCDAAALGDQAVLCVGGRPASVPLYRHIVERAGGRFLHHDGGDEHRSGHLESSLAAADFVICQTGCISHGAYWRVKDYCKRHGKSCVFVENPGSASLKRALAGVSRVDATR